MTDFRLLHPWWLLGLLLIPALAGWCHRRGWRPVWLVPNAAAWAAVPRMRLPAMAGVYAAWVLALIALARPQHIDEVQHAYANGYDLMLAIDMSGSMRAEDYADGQRPIDRLAAIKPVLHAFIAQRPADRIGMVLFAEHAYVLTPPTQDHDWLQQRVQALQIGMLSDGTAIGDALGLSLAQFEPVAQDAATPEPGSFVVLLSDGASNSGKLTPAQASALARQRGVRVFTLGAGRNGRVPYPQFDADGRRTGTVQRPSSLDETALRAIARETGGSYYPVGDRNAVQAAFAAIDAANKRTFQARTHVAATELFASFLAAALACLLAAWFAISPRRAPQGVAG